MRPAVGAERAERWLPSPDDHLLRGGRDTLAREMTDGAYSVRRWVWGAVVLIVLLTGFAGVAISASRAPAAGTSSPSTDGVRRAREATSLAAFERHFSVLRRRATAKDAIPPADLRAARVLAQEGADLDQSRRVRVLGDWTSYAIPGKTVICLFTVNQQGGGSACPHLRQASDGFLFTIGSGGSDGIPLTSVLLVGLVPDEVRKVKVTFAGGATKTLRVHNNGFISILSIRARRVSYRDNNGAQVRGVPSCGAC